MEACGLHTWIFIICYFRLNVDSSYISSNVSSNCSVSTCQKCADGYVKFSHRITTKNRCIKYSDAKLCDPRGSNVVLHRKDCICKNNVRGKYCDKCRRGFYNLQPYDPNGCLPCFCNKRSYDCTSATLFEKQIDIGHIIKQDVLKKQTKPTGQIFNITTADRKLTQSITLKVTTDHSGSRHLSQSFNNLINKNLTWYLKIPKRYLRYHGTLVRVILNAQFGFGASAPGAHRDSLRYADTFSAAFVSEREILWYCKNCHRQMRRQYRLTETINAATDNFYNLTSMGWQSVDWISTRRVFLKLSELWVKWIDNEAAEYTLLESLRFVYGSVERSSQTRAVNIYENCTCPNGYDGLSCENCGNGYEMVRGYCRKVVAREPRVNISVTSRDTITINTATVEFVANSDITIGCESKNSYRRWYRCSDHDCHVRHQLPHMKSELKITLERTSWYLCVPLNGAERQLFYYGRSVQLKVVQKPFIKAAFHTVNVVERSRQIHLTCTQPAGSANANVTWTKLYDIMPAAVRIKTQFNVHCLVIPQENLTSSLSGIYRCTAQNSLGSSHSDISLNVTRKAIYLGQKHVIDKEETVVANIGDTIRFSCVVIEAYPRPLILWDRIGNPLPRKVYTSMRNRTIHIPLVSIADEGTYECLTRSVVATIVARIHLYVRASNEKQLPQVRKEEIITVGLQGSIRCNDRFTSSISFVTWDKKNSMLPSRRSRIVNGILIIDNVKTMDEGSYICTAMLTNGSRHSILYAVRVDKLIPLFMNNVTRQSSNGSFISYDVTLLAQRYTSFTIEISFWAFENKGVLLYSGNPTIRDGQDFLSLSVVDGYIVFKFNLGSGTLIVKSRKPILQKSWTTVILKRNAQLATMVYEIGAETQTVTGLSPGRYKGLDLTDKLYVGCYSGPRWGKFVQQTGSAACFTGAIAMLRINNKIFEFGMARHNEFINHVGSFDVCRNITCAYGGYCQPNYGKRVFQCISPWTTL